MCLCSFEDLLNALTNRKSLARTSRTPGRTQLINFFQLDEERRLVDLPATASPRCRSRSASPGAG